MRIAIISITHEGALLAQRLTTSLKSDIDVFAKAGRNPAGAKEYEHLGQLVSRLFHQYDSLIFIMSVSVVVRIISPHVRDKRYDPAIIVADEAGSYAINLLSGHLGHANALTCKVGEAINARSTITTSTDGLQKPAVDLLAVKINAAVEPFENLHMMNAAIDKGDKVSFFIDSTLENCESYIAAAEDLDVVLIDMKNLSDASIYDAAVVITDKELYMVKPYVFLRPASLVIGINCRQGTTSSEILGAIAAACKKAGRSMKSIVAIASSDAQEDEIGVLATSQQIEVPARFFTIEDLHHCIEKLGLPARTIVSETTGVSIANVCEAAALLAAKADKLVLGATLYNNVTIAIAEAKSWWWE